MRLTNRDKKVGLHLRQSSPLGDLLTRQERSARGVANSQLPQKALQIMAGVLQETKCSAVAAHSAAGEYLSGLTPELVAMITDHKEITTLLREGGTLILNLSAGSATITFPNIAVVDVDWQRARRYAKRVRRGSYAQLAQQVVLKYPGRETTVYEEEQATEW